MSKNLPLCVLLVLFLIVTPTIAWRNYSSLKFHDGIGQEHRIDGLYFDSYLMVKGFMVVCPSFYCDVTLMLERYSVTINVNEDVAKKIIDFYGR